MVGLLVVSAQVRDGTASGSGAHLLKAASMVANDLVSVLQAVRAAPPYVAPPTVPGKSRHCLVVSWLYDHAHTPHCSLCAPDGGTAEANTSMSSSTGVITSMHGG